MSVRHGREKADGFQDDFASGTPSPLLLGIAGLVHTCHDLRLCLETSKAYTRLYVLAKTQPMREH